MLFLGFNQPDHVASAGLALAIEDERLILQRIPSSLQPSDVERRILPDPDGVRQTGRVLHPGKLHRLIERIAQEELAGFRLDCHKPIHVLGFQSGPQLAGVDLLGMVYDRFRLG